MSNVPNGYEWEIETQEEYARKAEEVLDKLMANGTIKNNSDFTSKQVEEIIEKFGG